MYAVVGATGNTGRAVVKELKALGENPVCVVRNADKAKEVLGADTKTAIAELDDRAGLEKALAGIKRVFIVTGHNPKSDVQQINVIDAAKAAGAEYIVKVSGGRDVIGPNVESVNGQAHYKIEEHLKKTGLQWCILSPGLFMQNIMGQAANIKNDGKIIQPWPKDLPVALIDVRDTGALGARVLREPAKHNGKLYTFTGVSTTFGEFAKRDRRDDRQADHLRGDHAGAGGSRDEVAQHAGLAGRASGLDRAGRRQGRVLEGEHAADPRHRRPRADHDEAVRAGLQGRVQLKSNVGHARPRRASLPGLTRHPVCSVTVRRRSRADGAAKLDRSRCAALTRRPLTRSASWDGPERSHSSRARQAAAHAGLAQPTGSSNLKPMVCRPSSAFLPYSFSISLPRLGA